MKEMSRGWARVLFLGFTLVWSVWGASGPQEVLRVKPEEGAVSLNGDWSFRYVAGLDASADEAFVQPSFRVADWKTMPVPGHWELHGFAPPRYASDTDPGLGLYRRTFRPAETWRGKRVFLRFDGVLFGMSVYVNGKPVGEWASSFHPVTFDITEALLPGAAENVLAVRVTTRSKGWDFDTMDCWGLSGIFRDVTLFALPEMHLRDFTARTVLNSDGTAQLDLDVTATGVGTVAGKLVGPDGKAAGNFRIAMDGQGRGSARVVIREPRLWTAETPSLYRMELDLEAGGKRLQHFQDRIGLRQVTVQEGVLLLNGKPVKLRGIDHHDMWPAEGRVATEALIRRDLELIRAANINFIRTSHYPPHPRFLELCDEMGIYVDDEVPFIHGRKNLQNPDYQDVLLTRARATVTRDKNHPSILLWSVGNENPINQSGLNAGRFVKELDPSRPITFPTIGSYFKDHYQEFPAFADLYSPHYPSAKTIREYAETLTRPIVVTEYAHERGLARSGGGVQEIWDAMYHSPRVAGGAVWMFQDQGILRTTADRKSVENADLMVWLDEHRYFDTNGYYAVDGIVYSDRTPQTDYWQLRKVYSPVQVLEKSLPVKPGAQTVLLHVENRFDFRTLAGVKLHWSLTKNRRGIAQGVITPVAGPHGAETVPLELVLPGELGNDVFALELRCVDEAGWQFYEHSLQLETQPAGRRWEALLSAMASRKPALEISDSNISVQQGSYQLRLDRRTGQCVLVDSRGNTLVSAIGPHTGRVLTINELGKQRDGERKYWRGELVTGASNVKTGAVETPEGVLVTVSGTYLRPGFPEEFVDGEARLLVRPSGAIEVNYRYAPGKTTGTFLETGYALELPAAASEFRWLGQGPYASYPGRDLLDGYGLFHMNREDQYFPGNRRGVELALLTNPAGAGVLMAGRGMTVSLDYREGNTVFSSLSGDAGADDEAEGGKSKSRKNISGKFTLLPLSDDWPALLKGWFGEPGEKAAVKQRYFHSYDQ